MERLPTSFALKCEVLSQQGHYRGMTHEPQLQLQLYSKGIQVGGAGAWLSLLLLAEISVQLLAEHTLIMEGLMMEGLMMEGLAWSVLGAS